MKPRATEPLVVSPARGPLRASLLSLVALLSACGARDALPPFTMDASVDAGDSAVNGEDGAVLECPTLRVLEDFLVVHNAAELEQLRCVGESRSGIVIGGANIRDLAPLRQLERADGLVLSGLPHLEKLTGLERLREIGGRGLSITRNPVLHDLSALASLASVSGGLEIGDNDELESLHGLEALSTVGNSEGGVREGYLLIVENPRLTSLAALAGLREVQAGLHICGNARLEELFAAPKPLGPELRLQLLFNPALAPVTATNFAKALVPRHGKLAANGPDLYEPPASCPFKNDGLCDESSYMDGDVIETCVVWPCCALEGPTMLCADGTDAPGDCPSEGGPPL